MTHNKQMNSHPGTTFIGFSGKKQSGKDTAAKFAKEILEQRGRRAEIIAFADPIKEICINLFGLPRELVYGNYSDKETLTHILWDKMPEGIQLKYSERQLPVSLRTGPMTIREVLQVFGTDIMRRMYPNIWAEAPFRHNWFGTDFVIFSDVRFLNEIEVVEKHRGVIIRVVRETSLSDTHTSETELDQYTFKNVIDNNGDLEDLYHNVFIFLKGIYGKQL